MDEMKDRLDERLIKSLRHNMGPVVMEALEDPDVVEVMANQDGTLWVEKFGSMEKKGALSPEQGRLIISLVASSLNTTFSADRPIVEGELPLDGSRFEGLMPPVVQAPVFSVRKKASRVFTLEEYVSSGIMTEEVYRMICRAIEVRSNILVIGGTGSGKTTLVNGVIHGISRICPDDRLVIMEDTAELQSSSENTVFLRSTATTSMRHLLKATMRLRPDRILVGEVRDGAALDLLKAWRTGHPGGVATVHANSALEGLGRLEDLIAEVSVTPMPRLIAGAVNLCLFIQRTNNGRRVTQAAHVLGFDLKSSTYTLEYVYDQLQ